MKCEFDWSNLKIFLSATAVLFGLVAFTAGSLFLTFWLFGDPGGVLAFLGLCWAIGGMFVACKNLRRWLLKFVP